MITKNNRLLETARGMETEASSSVFSMGELDGASITHNKQLSVVRNQAINLNANLNLFLKKIINFKKYLKNDKG